MATTTDKQAPPTLTTQKLPVEFADMAKFDRWAKLVTLTDADRNEIPVVAPYTGDILGYIPAGQPTDMQLAIERARTAQTEWAAMSVRQRKAIFVRYHDLLIARKQEILDIIQLESGKARLHAVEEAFETPFTTRHYALRAEKLLKPKRVKSPFPMFTATRVNHVPVGVVGIIAPWNYPLTLAMSDAVPAMLAGNTVILKPSEVTPYTALYALELLYEAGLPRDVMQIVTGYGPEIGPTLIAGVDFVCFTGSTPVGRLIAEQAGKQLIGCSLELGGKNPMIVLNDADISRTVDGAVRACFSNTGQLCISIERLYVQDGIYDRFVEKFVEAVQAMRVRADYDMRTQMGSLVSQQQLEKVKQHVEDAIAKGATVLAGGNHRPDIGPYFYEPTVLADVSPDMLVVQEETFGPVVSIYRFNTVDEAVQLANDTPYGLNASIWTRDVAAGHKLAPRILSGTININEGYSATWISTDAPMGGMKQSGLGRRHGNNGLLQYTEPQTVSVQRILPIAPPRGVSPPLYVALLMAILRMMRHIPGLR